MILQDRSSKTCGQCCLATILDITLEEAISLIGHSKGTRSKELTKHFNSSKNKRGFPPNDGRLHLCILRWKTKSGKMNTGNWHWVLYRDNQVYDPGLGQFIRSDGYFNAVEDARITSYFTVL